MVNIRERALGLNKQELGLSSFNDCLENSESTISQKEKRELTREELEESVGNLAMLLFNKDESELSGESEADPCRITDQLNSMRSTAVKLLTGFSAIISHVEAE